MNIINVNINKARQEILKECAKELAPAAMCLFQRSLDSGAYRDDWTNANVSPILKKSDMHRAENHQSLSLTPVVSKVLEQIVCHVSIREIIRLRCTR